MKKQKSNPNRKSKTENNRKKSKKNLKYNIFRVETDEKSGKERRIKMVDFFAANDDEAYAELKKYRKIANKIYKYYYERAVEHSLKDKDGNVVKFDSFEEMANYSEKEHWYDFIFDFVVWLGILKLRIRNAWQRAVRGHSEMEADGLFEHILEDLEYNLPILADNCENPVATFVAEARKQIHKADSSFDYEKSIKENPQFSEEEVKLGSELMKKTILGLLDDVRAFRFFSNYGIIDRRNPIEVETESKLSKSIPFVPGKYRTIDCNKLESIKSKYRNRIFNTLNRYAESIWC